MAGLDAIPTGATLAACQKNAKAPARTGLAIRLVCEVARSLHAASAASGYDAATLRSVSPHNVIVGYDGSVTVMGTTAASARMDTSSSGPAHLAPEQVSGGESDVRAYVFSVAVVLWEVLSGTSLFVRETASATRIAITTELVPDVRDVNPDVPPAVAEVLNKALDLEPSGRYASLEELCGALVAARAASGAPDASAADLGAWLTELVPPTSEPRPSAPRASVPSSPDDVPDLDFAPPPSSRRGAPPASAAAVPAAAPPAPPSARTAAPVEAPELEFELGSAAPAAPPSSTRTAAAAPALAPSTRMAAAAPALAPSTRTAAAAPALAPSTRMAAAPAAGKQIAFDAGDDDDDMELEHNMAPSSMVNAPAPASRPSSPDLASPSSSRGGGLELSAPARVTRERPRPGPRAYEEPGVGIKIAGYAIACAIAGGTAFGLFKYAGRGWTFDITRAIPHAFDGNSAGESGVVALVSLVAAVALGFLGLKSKPHAWSIVGAGGATLLIALAMVTVTLASTGDNPSPPDGALLIPYLFPLTVAMLAIGVIGRSGRLFAHGGGVRRAGALPVAAIGGLILFVAYAASRLAR